MPRYSYKARDATGKSTTGVIDAPSRDDALSRLRAERKTVTDILEGGAPIDVEEIKTKRAARGVKREEVIACSAQLSIMLETGVPLAEALEAFLKHAKSGNLRRVINIVNEHVSAGCSLSASLALFPSVFPTLMLALVKASEASGTLGSMLKRVSDYLAKERRTSKQITGALTYPLVMIGIAAVVTLFLVIWVLPRFARIYQSRSAALPTPTRIVLAISNTLQNQWPLLLAGLVGAVIGGFLFKSSPTGKRILDILRVRSPVLGPMFSNYYLSRATRTLATLLAAGVGLVDAIKIVKGVSNNCLWIKLWDDTLESITSGSTMAEVLSESKLMPAPVVSMISAAERSGRLPETLDRIADSAESDLDESVKSVTQLIEPAMITVMGCVVGGIAIALLMPIFSIGKVMAS